MNPILQYEQQYISLSDLEILLWEFGPNAIFEIGERCFCFYCNRANGIHSNDFYIKTYGSGLNADNEWYCE